MTQRSCTPPASRRLRHPGVESQTARARWIAHGRVPALSAALVLSLAAAPAVAQSAYPQSSSPSSSSPSISTEADGVKSLGTITLTPGEELSHPWISDEEIESRGLNADRFAWGEAAANAYKAHQYAEARELWHKAAKTGDPNALYALGVMSERGEGGPRDLDEALGWYYAAQQKGVREAKAKVASVSAELRKQAAASAAAGAAAEKQAAEEQKRAAAADRKRAADEEKRAAAAAKAKAADAAKKAPAHDDAGQLPPSPPPKVTAAPMPERDTPPQNPALRQSQPDSAPPKKSSAATPKTPAAPMTKEAAKAAPPAPEPKEAARTERTSEPAPGAASGGTPGATETASLPSGAVAPPSSSGDSKSKIEQYRRAAASKPEAAFMLGAKYADGRGVPKDDAEAVRFYRMAAEKGYAPAENNLGFMYAEGRGVKRDDAEAAKWYRRAADRNYAPAQTSLGMLYAAGRGVEKNDVEALALYSQAANQGYAPATANLAKMYAEGRGIERDEKTAQFLLSAIDAKPREGSGIYVDPGADGAK